MLEQLIEAAHCCRVEQHVAADGADLCRHMINDDELSTVPDRVGDLSRLVPAGAAFDVAVAHVSGFAAPELPTTATAVRRL